MGPPKEPPYWLRLYGAMVPVPPWAGSSKKPSESSALLRRNSKAEPCRLLVPDRVTAETTPPEDRPYSAGDTLVLILNSWTPSTPRLVPAAPPGVPLAWSLISVPSSMKLLAYGRLPVTLNRVPSPY